MATNDLGIESLSTGISKGGMFEYLDNIKAEVITGTERIINDVTHIENAINSGWQGVAKDRFLIAFKEKREALLADLNKEYDNLYWRLLELEEQYFKADANMFDE